MAKKQITEKELLASEANAEFRTRTEDSIIESEADSLSLDGIKSQSMIVPEDFDWDMDPKGFGNYTNEERAKLEGMYTTTLNSINKGEIISGAVVSMNLKDVVLNIGFKSDGMVPLSEFRDMPELKIGDVVEVFVEDQEDKNGQLILSRKRAKTQRSWDNINKALEMDSIINGFVEIHENEMKINKNTDTRFAIFL